MRGYEERNCTRYACVGEARLQLAGAAAESWGKVLDISKSGCMVSVAKVSAMRSGDSVDLMLRIGHRSMRMKAWVVLAVQTSSRVGLMFASMDPHASLALSGLIEELDALRPMDAW